MQPRENRTPVTIQAHMRGAGDWSRIMIRNISPMGMMAMTANPPEPGAYVEIRKASMTLVGRTIWAKGTAFGVQLVERLHFDALLRAANDSWAMLQSTLPAGLPASAPASTPAPPAPRQPARVGPLTWGMTLLLLVLAILCAGTALLPG